MQLETKWTKHAKKGLLRRGLGAYEVELAIQREHRRRTPNTKAADWFIRAELPERSGTLTVYYDWPAMLPVDDDQTFADEGSVQVVTVTFE